MFICKIYRRTGNVKLAREYCTRFTQIYEELRLPLERNRWVLLLEQAILQQQEGRLDNATSLTREAHKVVQLTKDFASSVYVEHSLAYYLLLSGKRCPGSQAWAITPVVKPTAVVPTCNSGWTPSLGRSRQPAVLICYCYTASRLR